MADERDFRHAQEIHHLMHAMMLVRDRLQVIADGEIERGHCVAGERECYGDKPGKRKVKLEDARKISKHCIAYLNKELNRVDDSGD